MRLTLEDACLLADRFNEFIQSHVGEDVATNTTVDVFRVEVLGKKKRVPHPKPPAPGPELRGHQ